MRPLCRSDVAARDRLRGLSETHVVGQQQSPGCEEPVDTSALVGVERPLELFDRVANLAGTERICKSLLEPATFVFEQTAQGGVVSRPCSGGEKLQQIVDELETASGLCRRSWSSRMRFRRHSNGTSGRPARPVPSVPCWLLRPRSSSTRSNQSPIPVSGRMGSQSEAASLAAVAPFLFLASPAAERAGGYEGIRARPGRACRCRGNS